MASLRGLLPPVTRFWTMWRRFQRRSGRGGPFPPRMILSLRVRQFRFSRCFDATMGFPGEGPFALTPKLKEKETARLKAKAEEEEEKEKKRKAGESVAAESSSSTCVQQELEHGFFACATFRDCITMHHAHVYGGKARPGVELKYVCNNVGCTAEKKGNFWYSPWTSRSKVPST